MCILNACFNSIILDLNSVKIANSSILNLNITAEVYSEPIQISKMELFAKLVNYFLKKLCKCLTGLSLGLFTVLSLPLLEKCLQFNFFIPKFNLFVTFPHNHFSTLSKYQRKK